MKKIYDELLNHTKRLALVGLGYVGMPIAVSFARRISVVGFDTNVDKIAQYCSGKDPTGEMGDTVIASTKVEFTSDEKKLHECAFIIVAVPTPVKPDKTPDLSPIESASHTVGRNLEKGSVVVYESTVYPGVTEEICIPILEAESGLICGKDFKVGYSPERINPGDKEHRLENIVKVVSGIDTEALEIIAQVYSIVVEAGVYKAESIKVAEAAKVIENSQRDINIAFMNELSIIFNRLGIETSAVLQAAATKWNFLNFSPGLVGGHCIGVDPYYLTYKAAQTGYHSQIILAGRRINDNMGRYVVECLIKDLIQADINIKNARIAILGLTFKENCPDIRNTKVIDMLQTMEEFGMQSIVTDPVADPIEAKQAYGLNLVSLRNIKNCDAVVIAVAHNCFLDLGDEMLTHMYRSKTGTRVLYDLKGALDRPTFEAAGYQYWSL